MKKLKFAIIGCGRISYKHVQGIVDNANQCELVALCDPVTEKALSKKDEYNEKISAQSDTISVYEDYKNMIEKEEIDVITIATESGYHADIAIYSMNNKIHVIVEKPMAMTIEDAEKMIECSQEKNVKLSVCHQNRFNPPIKALRKAIEAGRFGKIYAANARILWNRSENYYKQASWRGTKDLDGGCLMNQCIHNIDLLQWMLGGDVKTVQAMLDNYNHPYIEMEDYGSVQIRFGNGAIGNVEGTTVVFPNNLEETLTVLGEKGTVKIGGLAVNKLEAWKFEDAIENEEEKMKRQLNGEVDSVYGNGHTPLFADFIDAVNQNRKPCISGEDGIEAVKIILKAYECSR